MFICFLRCFILMVLLDLQLDSFKYFTALSLSSFSNTCQSIRVGNADNILFFALFIFSVHMHNAQLIITLLSHAVFLFQLYYVLVLGLGMCYVGERRVSKSLLPCQLKS